jgi:hypothetical protein
MGLEKRTLVTQGRRKRGEGLETYAACRVEKTSEEEMTVCTHVTYMDIVQFHVV